MLPALHRVCMPPRARRGLGGAAVAAPKPATPISPSGVRVALTTSSLLASTWPLGPQHLTQVRAGCALSRPVQTPLPCPPGQGPGPWTRSLLSGQPQAICFYHPLPWRRWLHVPLLPTSLRLGRPAPRLPATPLAVRPGKEGRRQGRALGSLCACCAPALPYCVPALPYCARALPGLGLVAGPSCSATQHSGIAQGLGVCHGVRSYMLMCTLTHESTCQHSHAHTTLHTHASTPHTPLIRLHMCSHSGLACLLLSLNCHSDAQQTPSRGSLSGWVSSLSS